MSNAASFCGMKDALVHMLGHLTIPVLVLCRSLRSPIYAELELALGRPV